MSKIRRKNTKSELAFRKALWAVGYRYQVDYKKLIGKPDILLKNIKQSFLLMANFGMDITGKKVKPKLRPIVNFGFPRLSKIWKETLK